MLLLSLPVVIASQIGAMTYWSPLPVNFEPAVMTERRLWRNY
jgi:hypothetical protein